MNGIIKFIIVVLSFLIVGAIISSIEPKNVSAPVGIFLAILALIIPIAITAVTNNKVDEGIEKIKNDIAEKKEFREQRENIEIDIKNYKETKHSLRYISDEQLKNNYQALLLKEENIERLAVEEEMVDRGFIGYSPMHDKLNKIKLKYPNK
jgi:hypothetical protein